MSKLRGIPSNTRRKLCLLCNRQLPKGQDKPICKPCASRHTLDTPCPACSGALHLSHSHHPRS